MPSGVSSTLSPAVDRLIIGHPTGASKSSDNFILQTLYYSTIWCRVSVFLVYACVLQELFPVRVDLLQLFYSVLVGPPDLGGVGEVSLPFVLRAMNPLGQAVPPPTRLCCLVVLSCTAVLQDPSVVDSYFLNCHLHFAQQL